MTNQAVTQLAPRASHSADSRNPRRAGNTQDPVQITYATLLDDAGLTARKIADILGHQSVTATGSYLKSSLGLLAQCALDPDGPASGVTR